MVRYGLIGYGRWGALHAASIRKTAGAELVAIAVASEDTASRIRSEWDVEVYTDYRELLKREDIDVVDIVVPNHLHYQVAMDALRAQKHLLMEKPLALTVEDCERIIDEANRRGRLIHVGHEMRFSPLWGRLKTMIAKGKIGKLKSCQIGLSRHPFREGSGGWRTDAKRVGNWILEEPVHFLDLLKWYFEPELPIRLMAAGNSRDAELESRHLYENMSATITFSDGGIAMFNQTLAAYEHHLYGELIGTRGVVKVWWSGATDETPDPVFKLEYYDGHRKIPLEVERTPGEVFELDFQIGQFTDVVAHGKTPTITAEDGLWAVKLSMAVQESIIGEKIVSL